MPHATPLIATIVIGLVLAFAGGFLASKLRLPPLVGYLLAGVGVGPFTPGFVADTDLAGQLAEIGVILLMFGVGLHFSIGDLLAVRKIAVTGALGRIAALTAVGIGLAHLWGWSLGAGLVLGLALSVASTVVLLRVLEERRALDTPDGRIAIGWLIVEDLAMVLALVLLPALAGPLGGDPPGPDPAGPGNHAEAGNLLLAVALTLGKVALFVALILVVGRRTVPWLLQQVARTGSRELFTLSVLATALGLAYGSAVLFGASFALGAFFAGVVLSESDLSHRAAADSLPLQDAFAVLFFVSVGMLFDPAILVREPLAVLAVVLIIVVGKSLVTFAIVLGLGYPLGTALTVAASLAQIGEFSFILAGLGVGLGLLPAEGRDLILAGALLSITLNPLIFAAADRLRRRAGVPAATVEATGTAGLRDHVVIVGYGRVGRTIGEALEAVDLPFAVVELDRRRAEELRGSGIAVVHGDADAPGVLAAAGIDRARLLIAAAPHGFQARRAVEIAREANPGIDTAVRTDSESELAYLEREGVGVAIMGRREVALGLLEHALRSLGLREADVRFTVQTVRSSGDGGAFERRSGMEPEHGAPELQPHRPAEDEPLHDDAAAEPR